ncbi:hypothetical protein CEXT_623101, partial [Caerostris extrusa]
KLFIRNEHNKPSPFLAFISLHYGKMAEFVTMSCRKRRRDLQDYYMSRWARFRFDLLAQQRDIFKAAAVSQRVHIPGRILGID